MDNATIIPTNLEYPTWINQEAVALTKKEQDDVIKHVIGETRKVFGLHVDVLEKHFNKCATNDLGFYSEIAFKFKGKYEPHWFRSNLDRARKYIKGFLVTIQKTTGYLELPDGTKGYKNGPNFMWIAKVHIDGWEFPYKKNNLRCIDVPASHLNNSVISNIAIRIPLLHLERTMSPQEKLPTQIQS